MGTATRLLLVVDALLFISSCQDRFEKVCETASFFFFFGCHFVTFCSTFITDAHFARFTNKKSRQHFRCRTRDKETIFSSSSSSSSSIDVRKRHVVCVCVWYCLPTSTTNMFLSGAGREKSGEGGKLRVRPPHTNFHQSNMRPNYRSPLLHTHIHTCYFFF